MKRSIFLLLAAVWLGACSPAQNNPGSTSLSATEFTGKIKQLGTAQLVDVRTPGEFAKGHLEEALNMDWNGSGFDAQIAALDKSQPVLIYCLSGGRSGSAADKLRKEGWQVYELSGGLMKWPSDQLPLVQRTTPSAGMSLQQYEAALQSDKLVLVDFYADWCAPCRKMKPFLEKTAADQADVLTLLRIDADKHPELCRILGVTGLPVLKLYKNSRVVWEHMGFIPEDELRKQISHNK